MLSERLAHDIAEAAQTATTSPDACLQRLADLATRAVPGCAGTVLALHTGEDCLVTTTHSSLAALFDRQLGSDNGPLPYALAHNRAVTVTDTLNDGRWPDLTSRALRHGIRSVHVHPHTYAAATLIIALHGARPYVFNQQAGTTAALAHHLATTLANVELLDNTQREATHLRRALTSRADIDQAKGMIMHALGCGPDEAFAELQRVSQSSHRKLADVARRLVLENQQRNKPDKAGEVDEAARVDKPVQATPAGSR